MRKFQLFQHHKGEFCLALVDVFGFDFDTAAAHFGVTKRTVYHWYEQNKAPHYIMAHLDIIARGFLPAYFPFNEWRIVGTDIHTPYGIISAFEVEFTKRYMWLARQASQQLALKRELNHDLQQAIDRILLEADRLQFLNKLAK